MRTLLFLAISLLVGSWCDVHKGRFVTLEGDEIQYYIENSEHHATLLLNLLNEVSHDPIVNATYSKGNGDIRFHILGNDHFESTEENFEDEAKITRELMESGIGRSLPKLSRHVFEETGVTGRENEGMMLLHQLAMFSHNHHQGAHTPGHRRKRNLLSHILGGGKDGEEASNEVEGVFPDDVVKACHSHPIVEHGGCTVDLAVENTDNICVKHDDLDFGEGWAVVHQFSIDEIKLGCYGLCGPWCTCWSHLCGDCCWHPGCYQHDKYCDKPSSLECKLGKGVVFGRKGIHTC